MTLRNERRFVHLRVHSIYSPGVGLSSPTEICRHARRSGYDAVALTDIHGTFGFVEFHRAARRAGVKPIYGSHVLFDTEGIGMARPLSLLLLALDRTGLRNLCHVTGGAAQARDDGRAFGYDSVAGHGDGLVAVAGLWPAPTTFEDRVTESLASLQGVYGERLFVEVRAGEEGIRGLGLARVAGEMGIAGVLMQDVRYVGPEKHQLLDLVASARDHGYEHNVHSEALGNTEGRGHGMRSSLEMSALYDEVPEAFNNASAIAALVHPDLLEGTGLTVDAGAPGGFVGGEKEDRRTLRTRVASRLAEKYEDPGQRDAAMARAHAELDRICEDARLVDAFLQFGEITAAVRRRGVRVGPATGLGLQSVCAFALGISGFDPYRFEPDFIPAFGDDVETFGSLDVQIPVETRDDVVEALEHLHDERGIAYVPSVEHITAARALRLVAARMGIKKAVYEELVKVAVGHPGASLRELVEENRRVAGLSRKSPEIRELISHAAAIEGLVYGFVRSRRTLILSPRPLRDFLAFTTTADTGERFVQATNDDFPTGRIRRVDLSTLSALSIVSEVDTGADERGAGGWTPAGDASAYRLIERGDLDGIYLLESPFSGRLARRFGIESFDDLVAFIALMRYRRGDVSFPSRVAAYRERSGPHADRAYSGDATTHTNGWLLFHDQLRTVASHLMGCSALEADRILERFRDHEPATLAGLRRAFMKSCVENGTELAAATEWFGRMMRLAGRVISRQAVVAEALLVSRMLYLKYCHRVRFLAAVLNHTGDGARREAVMQILERDGRLLPPEVNHSTAGFSVENGNVRLPLHVIPDVRTQTATTIARFRASERFGKWEDFRCFAEQHAFVYKEIEALAGAGALASLGIQAGDALPDGSSGDPSAAASRAAGDAPGQLDLGLSAPVAHEPSGPIPGLPDPVDPASSDKDGNKRVYYHVVPSTTEFYPHPSATPVELAGRIRDLHFFKTSSGKTVGFFVLFDESGSVRVFIPWESLRPEEPVRDGERVRIKGRVAVRDGNKVLDALEVERAEGGYRNGETTPDESAEGNP